MKKLNMLKMVVVTLLFSMTLIGSMPVETSALSMPLRAVVNGDRLYFPDGQPFVDKQSRIQVPIRFIAEALGVQVSWDGKTKK
ncbi:stalk domain-containing protein, partial [Paenibacillus plantiphilus]